MISNVRFIDAAQTNIAATMDGFDVSGISLDAVTARSGSVAARIADWVAAGNQIAAYTPPAPTVDDVVAERERRLALGFDYDFGDARGVHHIGTTAQDMIGWDEVSKSANAEINLGNPNGTFTTIVTNTGIAEITAMDWMRILRAAKNARDPLWQASFVLQAMNPIPSDYTSDTYWS